MPCYEFTGITVPIEVTLKVNAKDEEEAYEYMNMLKDRFHAHVPTPVEVKSVKIVQDTYRSFTITKIYNSDHKYFSFELDYEDGKK